MFQVMCIKKDTPEHGHMDLVKAADKIQIGSTYTVIDENDGYYELEEFPHPLKIWWRKECFAVMPAESADEIEATEQEAIIPKPELC